MYDLCLDPSIFDAPRLNNRIVHLREIFGKNYGRICVLFLIFSDFLSCFSLKILLKIRFYTIFLSHSSCSWFHNWYLIKYENNDSMTSTSMFWYGKTGLIIVRISVNRHFIRAYHQNVCSSVLYLSILDNVGLGIDNDKPVCILFRKIQPSNLADVPILLYVF